MINVLMISPIPPPGGGIASWTKRYCEFCNQKNIPINLVNTAILGYELGQKSKLKVFFEIKRNIKIIRSLYSKILNSENHIAHINSSCGRIGIIREYLCCLLLNHRKIPVVVHFRCDIENMLKGQIGYFFFKRLVRLADDIWVLNKNSYNFVQKVCNDKVFMLPNFVPNDFYHINREKKENNIKILYVGHVTEQKGSQIIFKLAEDFPDINFELVGSCDNQVIARNNKNNIHIYGEKSLDEIKEYYKSADIFLFPSKTEGFPNAVAEAMCVGIPIVASNVGAIPDMLESSGGFVCRKDNYEEFYAALKLLIKNKDLRTKCSAWNRNKAKKYGINTIMDSIFSRYEYCINNYNRR